MVETNSVALQANVRTLMEKSTIIIGAGVAGLTLAYRLALKGKPALVIEKAPVVGGLARSFTYDGFTFDIGPHRFNTDDKNVLDFVKDVLDEDYLIIDRHSAVRMFGNYFAWPLTLKSLAGMPLKILFSVGLDMVKTTGPPADDFKSYIINRYGRTLYNIFFEPYTRKFLQMQCKNISRDWAQAGIERAVIDTRFKAGSSMELLRTLLRRLPPLQFIYPASGGIGVFSDKLYARAQKAGTTAILNSQVDRIITSSHSIVEVHAGNKVYGCGQLIWTAPVTELLRILGLPGEDLSYLSLVLYNIKLSAKPVIDYQWSYFGFGDTPFTRVSCPVSFNPGLAPPSKAGICAEITCRAGDETWLNPEGRIDSVISALVSNNIIRSAKEIEGVHIERVPNAYPIYDINYKSTLKRAMNSIADFSNLTVLGRTGEFWYNNMDHSIEAAMRLAERLSPGGSG